MLSKQNNYSLLLPPYKLDYDNWSLIKAQDYLHWYVDNMPSRAEYVVENAIGEGNLKAPINPTILIDVWKWFLKNAIIEFVPHDIIAGERKNFGNFGESFISDERFSVNTEYIIRDIAMLVSFIFTTNHNTLFWDIITKPKKHIFYMQPVLKGFVNTSYGKPFKDSFQPDHMVYVQAAKLLPDDGKVCAAENDLYNLYNRWENDIPDSSMSGIIN